MTDVSEAFGIEPFVAAVLAWHNALQSHEVFSVDHLCMAHINNHAPSIITGVCYVSDPADHSTQCSITLVLTQYTTSISLAFWYSPDCQHPI